MFFQEENTAQTDISDPSSWTMDDVVCSADFKTVLSIRGVDPVGRTNGTTMAKLRAFCKYDGGMESGYAHGSKSHILKLIANRKKGIVYGE